MKYLPRVIDKRLEDLLKSSGAVLIEGCKWCGKTTTAKEHAKSLLEFQDPDRQAEYQLIQDTKPSLFLDGEKPRLFDEWQRYPVVWDSIRMDVDRTGRMGQYLLTGSAKPAEGKTMHTGTGRIARIVMRPMSFYESGFSDGKVSLGDIANGKDISAVNDMQLEQLADYIGWGGFPVIPSLSNKYRLQVAESYLDSVVHEDINHVDSIERNPDKMRSVLKSLARNVSTPVSVATIEQDTKTAFGAGVSRVTVRDYLETLSKLFVIYDVPATKLAFRSKSAIRTTPKKEFVDPSIAMAVLNMKPGDLLKDLRTFGFLFECAAMRDLIVYSGGTGENIYYYRDADNFEVDAILHLNNGKWGAIEIKLGGGQIEEAANNLLKFKTMVDGNAPDFLMVLTGTNYSYRRDDGVYVVSVGSLRD